MPLTEDEIARIVANLWWERADPVSEGRKGIAEDFAAALEKKGAGAGGFDKKKFLKKCGVMW
jgi:hypothetical protein